jgi:Fe-S oxidoreductase
LTHLQLPLLQPHREALEKCVYCPKLSRAACPVANVSASETLTPWGKMSMAYFAARGDVPIDHDHAAVSWACSACYACRERCEHHNDVASALCDTRAEMYERSVAPEAARRVADRTPSIAAEYRDGVLALQPEAPTSAETAVVLGCSYVRHHRQVAADALLLAERFSGSVRAVRGCCGLISYYAGDRASFIADAMKLSAEVRGASRVVVVDPGCAVAMQKHYPSDLPIPEIVPLVDVVFRGIERVPAMALAGRELGWQDPCQLGRGLGRYDEPRAVLARLTGGAPKGAVRDRNQSECSGGGGLLPVTYPEVSRAMADERIAEHRLSPGGGERILVTGCAQSLRRYRTRGLEAVDWVELLAEACKKQ